MITFLRCTIQTLTFSTCALARAKSVNPGTHPSALLMVCSHRQALVCFRGRTLRALAGSYSPEADRSALWGQGELPVSTEVSLLLDTWQLGSALLSWSELWAQGSSLFGSPWKLWLCATLILHSKANQGTLQETS